MSDKLEQRKVVAKGYFPVPGGGWRVFKKGEDIYVPAGFKAKWLEPSGYEAKTSAKASTKKAPASDNGA